MMLSINAIEGSIDPREYESVLAFKGSVTLRQIWARQNRSLADPKTQAFVEQLSRTNQQILILTGSELTLGTFNSHSDTSLAGDVVADLRRLSEERTRLEQELLLASPAYREFIFQTQLNVSNLKKSIPPGTLLIDFFEFSHVTPPDKNGKGESEEKRLLAFIVRPGREVIAVSLGKAAEITKQVEAWRSSYGRGYRPVEGKSDPAVELKKLVWDKRSWSY
jgi:hypothetical protein